LEGVVGEGMGSTKRERGRRRVELQLGICCAFREMRRDGRGQLRGGN
jgi:hypothetical protein